MSADIKTLVMSVLQKHGAVSIQSQPLAAGETPMRLPEAPQAQDVGLNDSLDGPGLPTGRCRMCRGWLYWVSVHGAVVCVTCHPPASRELVKTWHWLPEGMVRQVQ
jgi:hypothetical protein